MGGAAALWGIAYIQLACENGRCFCIVGYSLGFCIVVYRLQLACENGYSLGFCTLWNRLQDAGHWD
eukprot:2962305-Lingulodinium_polyedra.AAC.1